MKLSKNDKILVTEKALDVLVEIAFPLKRNHKSLQLLYQDSPSEEPRNPQTRLKIAQYLNATSLNISLQ
jgi:hypothetical protein